MRRVSLPRVLVEVPLRRVVFEADRKAERRHTEVRPRRNVARGYRVGVHATPDVEHLVRESPRPGDECVNACAGDCAEATAVSLAVHVLARTADTDRPERI